MKASERIARLTQEVLSVQREVRSERAYLKGSFGSAQVRRTLEATVQATAEVVAALNTVECELTDLEGQDFSEAIAAQKEVEGFKVIRHGTFHYDFSRLDAEVDTTLSADDIAEAAALGGV